MMSNTRTKLVCSALLLLLLSPDVAAQQSLPPPESIIRDSYVLGPDDEIAIKVLEAEELSIDPIRIGTGGYVNLPMIGRFRVAGLTAEQLETELADRLKIYVHEPNIMVSVTELRSQPVSVIGAVNNPGLHQLAGQKTLVEVLALAAGLREDAGHSVKLTRRLNWGRIPLPSAKDDPTGQFSVAEVSFEDVMEARNPQENVFIKPYDVISVPRADMIYVIGAVSRTGGFALRERASMSVLQALALAGGLARAASPKNTKILRLKEKGAQRMEISINLRSILANKAPDVSLRHDDILFIPRSGGKAAALRAAEAAVGIGVGITVYRGGIN